MWPMLLDYSREECRRILRRLELEAFSSIVTAFRAQGELTKEKKKLLQELSVVLSISTERHRSEIRRVVNDEKLNTVAEIMCGPGTSPDWAIEGRRLIPLLPRLVPQTAFNSVSNEAAEAAVQYNSKLLPPHTTGHKRVKTSFESSKHITANSSTSPNMKAQALATSSQSNVVVLPSGMSIQIKDGSDIESPVLGRKHRKPHDDSLIRKSPQNASVGQINSELYSSASSIAGSTNRSVNIPVGTNPLMITLSPGTLNKTSSITTVAKSSSPNNSSSQKVLLVSTSASSLPPSILQKSLSVPVVKTVSATKTTVSAGQSKSAASPSVASPVSSTLISSSKQSHRSKSVTMSSCGKGKQQNIIIPVSAGQQGSVRTMSARTSMQLKSEGVKIITKTIASNRLLPKSSTSNASKSITYSSSSGMIHASSPQTIVPSTGDTNVLVVNAKKLQGGQLKLESLKHNDTQLNAVKQAVHQAIAAGGIKSSSNVIVVKQSQLGSNLMGQVVYNSQKVVSTGLNTTVKTIITPSDHSLLKNLTSTSSSSNQLKIKPISSSTKVIESKANINKPNTLLADLMQASGIINKTEGQIAEDSSNVSNSALCSQNIQEASYNKLSHAKKDVRHDKVMPSDRNLLGAKKSQETVKMEHSQASSKDELVTVPEDVVKTPVYQAPIHLNLDQIPENSIFEIDAPEVAALLNQNGSLTPESTVNILKQAGYEVSNEQVESELKDNQIQECQEMQLVELPKESPQTTSLKLNDAQSTSEPSVSSAVDIRNVGIMKSETSKSVQKINNESVSELSNPAKPLLDSTENCENAESHPISVSSSLPKDISLKNDHQLFLNEVMESFEKQSRTNEIIEDELKGDLIETLKGSDLNSNSVKLTKVASGLEENNDIVLSNEKSCDIISDENKLVTSKTEISPQIELDAYSFVEDMLEQKNLTSSSNALEDCDLTDVKVDTKSETEFIRLENAEESKSQVKIHQYNLKNAKLNHSNVVLQDVESQECVKDAVHEIVTNESMLDEKFIPVSTVSITSQQNIEAVSLPLVNSTVCEILNSTLDVVSSTRTAFEACPNLSLVSNDTNSAITEVTSSVNAPMMISQIVEPSSSLEKVLDKKHIPAVRTISLSESKQGSIEENVVTTGNEETSALKESNECLDHSNIKALVVETKDCVTLHMEDSPISEQNSKEVTGSKNEDTMQSTCSINSGAPLQDSIIISNCNNAMQSTCNQTQLIENDLNSTFDGKSYENCDMNSMDSLSSNKQSGDSPLPVTNSPKWANNDDNSDEKAYTSQLLLQANENKGDTQCGDTDFPFVSSLDKLNEINSTPDVHVTKLANVDAKDIIQEDSKSIASNVTVEMETIDTTNMKFEDFASQRIQHEDKIVEISSFEVHEHKPSTSEKLPHLNLESVSSSKIPPTVSENSENTTRSKKKRKFNVVSHPVSYSGHVASWVRSAMGLVQRVSKFRGSCRTKSDQDAAHWFLMPVSEEDVPDYYKIIKQPMDFSTIKKKLEDGLYGNICEFHEDMLLIKSNCETYNPPNHQACLDCDEVFTFYLSEYDKLMEKWQRSHILSSPKRSKTS